MPSEHASARALAAGRALRPLRFIGAYFIANLQAALEYRGAFWLQVLTMSFTDSLWLSFWWLYFQRFPLVNGWQQTDIVIIWATTASGFGLAFALCENTTRLPLLITSGGLDAYLTMPRNVLLHLCVASSDPTAFGDILFGLAAFLLLRPSVAQLGLFLLLSGLVALIFVAFTVLLGALAFFLGNVEGLAQQLLSALVSLSSYPMNIFRGTVKLLLFTLLPAGFISFVPLQLLRHFTWPLLAGLVGFILLFSAAAAALFYAGLRRYESGNLLGMQSR
jgi:ABC-2 type transport system permease protein